MRRLILALVWLSSPAFAQETRGDVEGFAPRPFVGHPLLDMRVGASVSTPLSHPYLCAEVYPLARVSVEACGNGGGFLHRADVADLAHFRVRGTVVQGRWDRDEVGLVLGAGFAEVARGEDAPGFQFGPAQSDDQASGAGPEASVSGKARHWFHERAYVVLDVNAGAAWVQSAPVVIGRGGAAVPFCSASVGLGF